MEAVAKADEETSFNTQPPEGGWICGFDEICHLICFNTQPPEGGWIGSRSRKRCS